MVVDRERERAKEGNESRKYYVFGYKKEKIEENVKVLSLIYLVCIRKRKENCMLLTLWPH